MLLLMPLQHQGFQCNYSSVTPQPLRHANTGVLQSEESGILNQGPTMTEIERKKKNQICLVGVLKRKSCTVSPGCFLLC